MMGCVGASAVSRRREALALLSSVLLLHILAAGSSAGAEDPLTGPWDPLGARSITPTSVSLTWTAVGDDGNTGTATYYDLRYATSTITEVNWCAATQVADEPVPQPAGSAEAFTLTELTPATTYFFALKVGDEVPNWSALSNIATVTTLSPTPPVVALALCDIPVAGTQACDYTCTHASDDIHEVITETASDPQAPKWYSMLEHRWTFDVPADTSATFYLEAHRPCNSDHDDFAFEYSSDGCVFANLVTVASPVEQSYCVPLPAGTCGTVYVRVIDTNRVQGRQSLDRIYIDYMSIESGSVPGMFVRDMVVTRRSAGHKVYGVCNVWIQDHMGLPVCGATVYASYTGATNGSDSGVTGLDGLATIESSRTKPSSGQWCFEITSVVHEVFVYDPAANQITVACEDPFHLPPPAPPSAQIHFGLGGDQLVLQCDQQVVRFSLPEPTHVQLQVFSVNGRRVATLVDDWRSAGTHTASLEPHALGSGVYFLRLDAGRQHETRRVTLIH
jgi:hypothetical protein